MPCVSGRSITRSNNLRAVTSLPDEYYLLSQTAAAFDAHIALSQFREKFVAPYKSVIEILANEALQPLASGPIPTTADQARVNLEAFTAAAKHFHDALVPLTDTLASHKTQLEAATETAIAERSAKQTEVQTKEEGIRSLDALIAGKQAEEATAQQQLAAAEQSYQAAAEQTRQAERRVEEPRRCILRRKRFLGTVLYAYCDPGRLPVVKSRKAGFTRLKALRPSRTSFRQKRLSRGRAFLVWRIRLLRRIRWVFQVEGTSPRTENETSVSQALYWQLETILLSCSPPTRIV